MGAKEQEIFTLFVAELEKVKDAKKLYSLGLDLTYLIHKSVENKNYNAIMLCNIFLSQYFSVLPECASKDADIVAAAWANRIENFLTEFEKKVKEKNNEKT